MDSTLCGIEGIDWLASRHGESVAAEIASLTDRAMQGDLALEEVYAKRLEAVRPDIADVSDLSTAYIASLAPHAQSAVAAWRNSGKKVVLVSGGIRSAIAPLASLLGIQEADLHAVTVHHDSTGGYAGFDESSPLSVATGKRDVVAALGLERPILAVGDGSTDLMMREAADFFAAYTGFVSRPQVIARADAVVRSFEELDQLVYSA